MNSTKFDQIVSQLEKARLTGSTCRARCPVHGSKGQTLSVSQKDGGYVVAHCFSCNANGPDVVKALGLPLSLLFPDDDYVPPAITKKMRSENIEDGLVVQFSAQAKTLEDNRRLTKARERAKGYRIKAEEAEVDAPSIDHPALDDFKVGYRKALEESPALRTEIVENHWESVAERAELWLKSQ